jgi:hypothetical protein
MSIRTAPVSRAKSPIDGMSPGEATPSAAISGQNARVPGTYRR